MTMWNQLATRFRDARGDERGAVAIQFALLLIPIGLLTFGLIDISRVSVQKRQLQDALDAATLMAARSTATTDAGLDTVGDAALGTEMEGLGVPLTAADSSFALGAGNTVVGAVSAKIEPIVAWRTTRSSTIHIQSVVTRSVNKLEVALVLDNTGSMASKLGKTNITKISSLTTASKSLVTTLSVAARRSVELDSVKISVVPFSMTVNIGSSYQGQTSWLTGQQPTAYGTDLFATSQNRFTLLSNLGLTWRGCVESRPAPFDVTDDAPSSAIGASMFVPFFAPDEPDDNVVNTTTNSNSAKYRDTKVVTNPTYPINNNWLPDVTAPTGTLATAWATRSTYVAKYAASAKKNVYSGAKTGTDYGPNAGCGLTSLLRLTNVRDTAEAQKVTDKLGLMVANGNTNVAMGLMWGWHTLSHNAPFGDGVANNAPHVSKVIVLLTDGDNTNDVQNNPNNSIYTGYGYIAQGRLRNASNVALTASSTAADRLAAIDSREAAVCANAKAAGVLIYSIGVGVSSHSKSILQTCASRSDMYYDVTDASQLTAVFDTIAGSIQSLHISK